MVSFLSSLSFLPLSNMVSTLLCLFFLLYLLSPFLCVGSVRFLSFLSRIVFSFLAFACLLIFSFCFLLPRNVPSVFFPNTFFVVLHKLWGFSFTQSPFHSAQNCSQIRSIDHRLFVDWRNNIFLFFGNVWSQQSSTLQESPQSSPSGKRPILFRSLNFLFFVLLAGLLSLEGVSWQKPSTHDLRFPLAAHAAFIDRRSDGFGTLATTGDVFPIDPIRDPIELTRLPTPYPAGYSKTTNSFFGGTTANGFVYVAASKDQISLRINAVTGQMFTIANPAGVTIGSNGAFAGAVYDSANTNCVYFIPHDANRMVRVDASTFAVTSININVLAVFTKTTDGTTMLAGGIIINAWLYFAPYTTNYLLRYNLLLGTTIMISSIKNSADRILGGTFDGQWLWMASHNTDVFFVIELNALGMVINNYGQQVGSGMSGAIFDGTSTWFLPGSSDFISWADRNLNSFDFYMNNSYSCAYCFSGGVLDGRNIWLVPYNSKYLVSFSTVHLEFRYYDQADWRGAGISPTATQKFRGGCLVGDELWLFPANAPFITRISRSSMSVSETAAQTSSRTLSSTKSASSLNSRSVTSSPTLSSTNSASSPESRSVTSSPTPSVSVSRSISWSPSTSISPTLTPPPTLSPSASLSFSRSSTATPPPTPSVSRTLSKTTSFTKTPPPTDSSSVSRSTSVTLTLTPPPTGSQSTTVSATPSTSISPSGSMSMTSSVTTSSSISASPSNSRSLSISASHSPSETASSTATRSFSPSASLSASTSATRSATRTSSVSKTESSSLSQSPSVSGPTTSAERSSTASPSWNGSSTVSASLSTSSSRTHEDTVSSSTSPSLSPSQSTSASATWNISMSASQTRSPRTASLNVTSTRSRSLTASAVMAAMIRAFPANLSAATFFYADHGRAVYQVGLSLRVSPLREDATSYDLAFRQHIQPSGWLTVQRRKEGLAVESVNNDTIERQFGGQGLPMQLFLNESWEFAEQERLSVQFQYASMRESLSDEFLIVRSAAPASAVLVAAADRVCSATPLNIDVYGNSHVSPLAVVQLSGGTTTTTNPPWSVVAVEGYTPATVVAAFVRVGTITITASAPSLTPAVHRINVTDCRFFSPVVQPLVGVDFFAPLADVALQCEGEGGTVAPALRSGPDTARCAVSEGDTRMKLRVAGFSSILVGDRHLPWLESCGPQLLIRGVNSANSTGRSGDLACVFVELVSTANCSKGAFDDVVMQSIATVSFLNPEGAMLRPPDAISLRTDRLTSTGHWSSCWSWQAVKDLSDPSQVVAGIAVNVSFDASWTSFNATTVVAHGENRTITLWQPWCGNLWNATNATYSSFSHSLTFVLSQPLHTGIAAAIVLSPSFAVCNVSLDHGEIQARVALEQCNGTFVVDASQAARAALLQSNGTVTETWFTHLPPTPRVGVVRAMTGCPSNAFPFTADCNLEGATTLQVEGFHLEAAVRMDLVATSGSYPLLRSTCTCEASADLMTVICSRCSGYGDGLIAVLYDGSGGEVARSALPLVSFELGRDDLCPIGANGLLCSGHGMCDASRGLCLCEQHVSFGFWGEDCSSCTSMFNDSSLCSISCPVSVNGAVCSGDGPCKNGQCWCGISWTGTACGHPCDGQNGPCSGHGTCDTSTGTCYCSANYTGSGCEDCRPGMSGLACDVPCPMASGVACAGHGACVEGGCICDSGWCGVSCSTVDNHVSSCVEPCMFGFFGPLCNFRCAGSDGAQVCTGHGTCSDGLSGSGGCLCEEGYGGLDCSNSCPRGGAAHELCGGHGVCLPSGVCGCDRFYGGPACSQKCAESDEGLICSGHGQCLEGYTGSGECVCDEGYRGANCTATCTVAIGLPCSGRGYCLNNGLCDCFQDVIRGFWGGSDCAHCDTGYGGSRCNVRCARGSDGSLCSGHGTCGPDGVCQCWHDVLGHWDGVACNDCASGWLGSHCTEECRGGACVPCGGHGSCSDGIDGTGMCACDPEWAGTADCTGCAAGQYGPACDGSCPRDRNGLVCGEYGTCADGRSGSGICECFAGYDRGTETRACDACAPDRFGRGCAPCPRTGGLVCGGNGECSQNINGTGACLCYPGFGGPTCMWYCGAYNGTTCGRGACTASGSCLCEARFALNSTTGQCDQCVAGLYGSECTSPCLDCVNGFCDAHGTCVCRFGYWGMACENECIGTAENPCSGHGACHPQTGVCQCEGHYVGTSCNRCATGWTSSECSLACPVNNDTFSICSGRGSCFDGQCHSCTAAYEELATVLVVCGAACEQTNAACGSGCPDWGMWGPSCGSVCPVPAGSTEGCGGHGICRSDGTCLCFNGYSGGDCSTQCLAHDGLPCSGHGVCREGQCVCLSGYWGAACSNLCPGGAATPCNNRGRCHSQTGLCECEYGYGGHQCDELCPGGDRPCLYRGLCVSGSACSCFNNETHGHFSGTSCEACAFGWSGPRCKEPCPIDRGVVGRYAVCTCIAGYSGYGCSVRCPQDELGSTCAGHGSCESNSTTSWCVCDAGFYGKDCRTECNAAICSERGLYRSMCARDGSCVCRVSVAGLWTGDKCDECVDGFWGSECNAVCDCNGNGKCDRLTGKCQCFANEVRGHWAGIRCGQCARGYTGSKCILRDLQPSSVSGSTAPRPIVMKETPSPITGQQQLRTITIVRSDDASLPVVVQHVGDPTRLVALYASSLTGELLMPVVWSTRLDRDVSWLQEWNQSTFLVHHTDGTIRFLRYNGGTAFPTAAAAVHTAHEQALPDSHQQRGMSGEVQEAIVAGGTSSSAYIFWMSQICWVVHDGWNPVLMCLSNSGDQYHFECDGVLSDAIWATTDGSTIAVVGRSRVDEGNWAWCVAAPLESSSAATVTSVNSNVALRGRIMQCRPVTHHPSSSRAFGVCVVSLAEGGMGLFSIPYTGNAQQSSTFGEGHLIPTALVVDDPYNVIAVSFHSMYKSGEGSSLVFLQLSPLKLVALTEKVTGTGGIIVAISADVVNRFLLLVIEMETTITYEVRNFFGEWSAWPLIVEASGSMSITMNGIGFPLWSANRSASCVVGFTSGNATTPLANGSQVVCELPAQSQWTSGACDMQLINFVVGERRTLTTYVGLFRPGSANLDLVGSGDAVSAVAAEADSVIWIDGVGFFTSSVTPSCRVRNAHGIVAVSHNATVTSGLTATCGFPPMPMLPNGTVVEFSHDGQNYGISTAPIAIVGPIHHLAVDPVQLNDFRANFLSPIPPFTVTSRDLYGNERGALESDEMTVQCTSIEPGALIGGAAETVRFSPRSVQTSRMVQGAATMSGIILETPKVGVLHLTCFVIGQIQIRVTAQWNIVVGEPVQLGLARGITASMYEISVQKETFLEPSLGVWTLDGAGNVVSQHSIGPATLHASVAHEGLDGNPVWFPVSYLAFLSSDGEYSFENVNLRTVFGRPVLLQISVEGLSKLMIEIKPARCDPTQRAVDGSFRCEACPEHAVCDGTSTVTAPPGYWRAWPWSSEVYQCAVPSACAGDAVCSDGYTGLVCQSCASGFSHTGALCEDCLSDEANGVLISVFFVGLTIITAYLSIGSMKARDTSQLDKGLKDNHWAAVAIVFKLAITHLQIVGMIPAEELGFPVWVQKIVGVAGRGSQASARLSFVGCVIADDAISTLHIQLISFLLLAVGVSLISLGLAVWDAVGSASGSPLVFLQSSNREVAAARYTLRRRASLGEHQMVRGEAIAAKNVRTAEVVVADDDKHWTELNKNHHHLFDESGRDIVFPERGNTDSGSSGIPERRSRPQSTAVDSDDHFHGLLTTEPAVKEEHTAETVVEDMTLNGVDELANSVGHNKLSRSQRRQSLFALSLLRMEDPSAVHEPGTVTSAVLESSRRRRSSSLKKIPQFEASCEQDRDSKVPGVTFRDDAEEDDDDDDDAAPPRVLLATLRNEASGAQRSRSANTLTPAVQDVRDTFSNSDVTVSGDGTRANNPSAQESKPDLPKISRFVLIRFVNMSVAGTVCALFLLYPAMVSSAASLLDCVSIQTMEGATLVVRSDMSVPCEGPRYDQARIGAWLVLLLIGLGGPLVSGLAVLGLCRYTCDSSLAAARMIMHFMTGGYREGAWYWECVVLCRKFLLVGCMTVVGGGLPSLFGAMWTLIASLCVTLTLHQFSDHKLLFIDVLSLSLALSMYAASGAGLILLTSARSELIADWNVPFVMGTAVGVLQVVALTSFAVLLVSMMWSEVRKILRAITSRTVSSFLGWAIGDLQRNNLALEHEAAGLLTELRSSHGRFFSTLVIEHYAVDLLREIAEELHLDSETPQHEEVSIEQPDLKTRHTSSEEAFSFASAAQEPRLLGHNPLCDTSSRSNRTSRCSSVASHRTQKSEATEFATNSPSEQHHHNRSSVASSRLHDNSRVSVKSVALSFTSRPVLRALQRQQQQFLFAVDGHATRGTTLSELMSAFDKLQQSLESLRRLSDWQWLVAGNHSLFGNERFVSAVGQSFELEVELYTSLLACEKAWIDFPDNH